MASQISVSHVLMHTITTLLTATPPTGTSSPSLALIHTNSIPGAKILVLGTMTLGDDNSLDDHSALNLPSLFMAHLKVPLLDVKGISAFLTAKNIHR